MKPIRNRRSLNRSGNFSQRSTKNTGQNQPIPGRHNLIYPTLKYEPPYHTYGHQVQQNLNTYLNQQIEPLNQTLTPQSTNMFAYQNYVMMQDQQVRGQSTGGRYINGSQHLSQLDTIDEDYNDNRHEIIQMTNHEQMREVGNNTTIQASQTQKQSIDFQNNEDFQQPRRVQTSHNHRQVMTQRMLKLQTPTSLAGQDQSDYFFKRNRQRNLSTQQSTRSKHTYHTNIPSSTSNHSYRLRSLESGRSWLPSSQFDIMNITLTQPDLHDYDTFVQNRRKMQKELGIISAAKQTYMQQLIQLMERCAKVGRPRRIGRRRVEDEAQIDMEQMNVWGNLEDTLEDQVSDGMNQQEKDWNQQIIKELAEDDQQAQSHEQSRQAPCGYCHQPLSPGKDKEATLVNNQDYLLNIMAGTPQNEKMRLKLQEQKLLNEYEDLKSKTDLLEKRFLKRMNKLMQLKHFDDFYQSKGLGHQAKLKDLLSKVLLMVSGLKKKVYLDMRLQDRELEQQEYPRVQIGSNSPFRQQQDLASYLVSPTQTRSAFIPSNSKNLSSKDEMLQTIHNLEQQLRERTDKALSGGQCFELVHTFKMQQSKRLDEFQDTLRKMRDKVQAENKTEVDMLIQERKSLQIEAFRLAQIMQQKIENKVKKEANLIVKE